MKRFASHLGNRFSFRDNRQDTRHHGDTKTPPGILRYSQPLSCHLPSADQDDGDCYIGSLPAELLLAILYQYGPDIKDRIILTHVCRHWRELLLSIASFWSNVQIAGTRKLVATFRARPYTRNLDNFISLLTMQVDRTGSAPLDVSWGTDHAPQINSRILAICRRKAPFTRWRSLILMGPRYPRHAYPDDLTFEPNDAFTILDSLAIDTSISPSMLEVVSRTSARLRVLEIRTPHIASLFTAAPTGHYEVIIGRVSHLILPKGYILAAEVELPSNLAEVEAETYRIHRSPNILRLKLSFCILGSITTQRPDLRRLTSLTVTDRLELLSGCDASLPSLRHLFVTTILFRQGATLSAPKLETLRILPRHHLVATRSFSMLEMLRHPSYSLSPMDSLDVDVCFPPQIITKLLEHSPRVQHVSLRFNDELGAREMMDQIFGEWPSLSVKPAGICPQLRRLRLNLHWTRPNNTDFWRIRASQAKASRTASEGGLAILASWKGDGTYVVLA